MLKRLLMIGTLLLVLMAGFAIVPAKQAHASSETCTYVNGQPAYCGDPHTTGCDQNQQVLAESDIADNGKHGTGQPGYAVQIKSPTWAVELIESNLGGACSNMAWAYLKRVSGSGCIYPDAQNLQVYGQAIDTLYSTTFCNGAYTNMVPLQTGSFEGGTDASYAGPIWNGSQITMSATYNPVQF